MFKEEMEVVLIECFIGKVVIVICGKVECGMFVEVKLKDLYGLIYWVFVEFDEDGESFSVGEEVIVVV